MLKRSLEAEKDVLVDEAHEQKQELKLYVGNLDHRVTEYHIIKMFSPFGKIRCEEYMWHTHGPKRGEPRGFAFVEYSKREDAEKAKESMNGRMAFGRPLVVRFVEEKVVTRNADAPLRTTDSRLPTSSGMPKAPSSSSITSTKSAKIAAIQNKLKLIDKEKLQVDNPGSRKQARMLTSRAFRQSSQ